MASLMHVGAALAIISYHYWDHMYDLLNPRRILRIDNVLMKILIITYVCAT